MSRFSASGLRPLIKIGWRSIHKARLRSLLIFSLVAVVVASGTFAAIANRSTSANAEDVRLAEFGGSNFRADFATTNYGPGGGQIPYYIPPVVGVPPPGSIPTAQRAETSDELDARAEADREWLANFDVSDAELQIEQAIGVDVSIERRSFVSQLDGPFGSRGAVANRISDLDPSHPAAAGTISVVSGRLPVNNDEIAVHDRDRVGQPSIGDQITLGAVDLTLVGFITNPANRHDGVAIVGPDAFDQIVDTTTGVSYSVRANVSGGPATEDQAATAVASIVDRSVSARTPTSLLVFQNNGWARYNPALGYGPYGPSPIVPAAWPILISALLGTQIALVCAAAFAVGIRRKTKEFGQLMTLGADDRHIRRLAQVEAGLLGITGAIVGLGVGVLAASLVIPAGWLDTAGIRIPTGVRWSILDWLGPAAVGIFAVVVAAWWPIRVLTRAPIPGVLEGRLPSVAVKKTTPRWGFALVAAGALFLGLGAQTLNGGTSKPSTAFAMLVLGIITMIGGAILLIGTILSIVGRRSDRLPLLARLAVRNSDRQRSRSWVVVGAFIAALAIPIVVGASIKAYPNSYSAIESSVFEARLLTTTRIDYQPPSPTAIRLDGELEQFDDDFSSTIGESFPIAGTVDFVTAPGTQVRWVSDYSTYGGGRVVVATQELRDLLNLDRSVTEQLDAGAVVNVSTYRQVYRGDPRLGVAPGNDPGWPIKVLEGPAIFSRDTYLVAEQTLDDLGASYVATGSLRLLREALNSADEEAVRQTGNQLWTDRFGVFSYNERTALEGEGEGVLPWLDLEVNRYNNSGASAGTVRLWSTLISVALAVLVALATSSLSAVEMTAGIESMIATGAAPSIRRRLLGAQTLYHLLVAAMLAIPLGLLAFWVATSTDDYRATPTFTVPWLSIGITAILIPLVVALAITAIFRNGKPAVSRRLS